MESARVDQRRETGQRTRTRLMDAALDLLAERGGEAVTATRDVARRVAALSSMRRQPG